MIEFKQGIIWKDGISILKIIQEDLSLNAGEKDYERKLLSFYERFVTNLMNCHIEDIDDNEDAIMKLESAVSSSEPPDRVREHLFNVLMANPHFETIYKKAYYQFKSEIILKHGIEYNEGIDELRDGGIESVSDTLDIGENTSNGIGFLSIFFSSKYRLMTDKEVKKELLKGIILWIIGLVATSVLMMYFSDALKNVIGGVVYFLESLLIGFIVYVITSLIKKYNA